MVRPGARFAVGLQTDRDLGWYREIARHVEDLGFDGLSVFNDLGFPPPLPPLLAAAESTARVDVGVACYNTALHHPVEIAGQFAMLHRASPGRAYLGLTRGAWTRSIGVGPIPFDRFGESIGVIRYLLAGHGTGYRGKYFQIEPGFRLRTPVPEGEVPVLLGVWGARGAELARRCAGEVKLGGCANPAMIAQMHAWLTHAGPTSRRPVPAAHPPAAHPSVVAGAVTVVDRDRRAARRRARTEVAMYVDVVAALDRTVQLPEGLLAALRDKLLQGDDRGAGALIPDDVLDLFCLAGTPDDVAEHAGRMIRAGADRIEFGPPHGLDTRTGITLLGADVLPAVRNSIGNYGAISGRS